MLIITGKTNTIKVHNIGYGVDTFNTFLQNSLVM
jgi:hypothetical protein